ncbi:pentatricopeptide repeat-containing protein At1g64100 isoform X9 [Gossypium hirsutum]|uniref:Pentatricopeptide repeat-containing protein At1g64100 isoform X9 n=1 Tax=Gossypium hirsutum TaxID=3635 RepID=A0ABM3BJ10_GOSHI|nr:pentatricopeptide repeat-containing protein At1g64100-like isoform X9 [Gossypium hirsutum]
MGKINAFYGKYLTDFFPVRHFPRDGQRQISFLFSRSWLKLGVKPDVVTFSTLIKGLCQRSKISQAGFLQNNYTSKATELLIEMVGKGFFGGLCTATLFLGLVLYGITFIDLSY